MELRPVISDTAMIPYPSSAANPTTDVSHTSAAGLVVTVMVVTLVPLIATLLWSHPFAAAGLAVGILVRPLFRVTARLARQLATKIRAIDSAYSFQRGALQVSPQEE